MTLRLRCLLATMALATGFVATWAGTAPPPNDNLTHYLPSLTLGDIAPIYDHVGKRYLLPLSTQQRGKAQPKAVVAYQDTQGYTLVCGDQHLAVGDSAFLEAKVTGVKQRFYLLSSSGDTVATADVEGTFLPVVALTTADDINGKTYTLGDISVWDADKRGTQGRLSAQLRYRGATAQTMTKKSFAVKIVDESGASKDATFGGLREDNNWILDAMAVDLARMRNRVSTDLWNDFSTKPAHFANEKKAVNGTRGFFVEVVLNGNYHGLYCMTEKVDRKQLRLKKYKTDKATGKVTLAGLLYKADHWSYATFMGHELGSGLYPGTPPQMYSNQSDTWQKFEMAYPEVADGDPIDWAPLYNAVSAVASNDTARFRQQAGVLFDLPVVLDYYLFVELMLASDNHGKNMFYHIYDVGQSKMLGITPWDLDGTWGRDYYSRLTNTQDATQDYIAYLKKHEHGEYTLFKRLREGAYPGWYEALATRYASLRETHFSPERLAERFANYNALFVESGAAERERKLWNTVDNRYILIPYEVRLITTWLKSRIATLDKHYGYTPTGVTTARSTTALEVSATAGYLHLLSPTAKAVTVVSVDGKAVWSGIVTPTRTTLPLPKGIYIVDGHKVVVP